MLFRSSRLKVAGEGEAGENGGPSGSLYVRVLIKPHSLFERQENHLYCEFLIPYTLAVLGGDVTVTTFDGPVKLHIPAGTPSGKILRLKDKGMPSVRDGRRGDLMVRVDIDVPTRLSEKERRLFQELAKEQKDFTAEPRKKGFFDRFKESF